MNHEAGGRHAELHMSFGGVGTAGGSKPASQERYVWEMRSRSPNVTPASTVLNSPDLNAELQYAPMHHHQTFEQLSPPHQLPGYLGTQQQQQQQSAYYYQRPLPHQIRVGRSPGSSQFEPEVGYTLRNLLNNIGISKHVTNSICIRLQGLASPGSPTDVGKADGQCLRDGEIVVFDDIDTNWMNKSTALAATDRASNEDVLKVTKMIGQLPIAEYEGSPRRFGNQQQQQITGKSSSSSSGFPKRAPGFPQRVSPTTQRLDNNNVMGNTKAGKASVGNLIDLIDHESTSATASSKTPTFDYLYEFSETRKVLEEFFKANPDDDDKRFTDYTTESGDDMASSVRQQIKLIIIISFYHFKLILPQDLRPRVCDVDKHIEQAYIGQRLARTPKDELYMVHRSPRMQVSAAATGKKYPA